MDIWIISAGQAHLTSCISIRRQLFLDVSFEKMLESRRNYPIFIRKREDKYYPYSTEKDILCWEKNRSCFRYPTVRHSILEAVSLRHTDCPGHTPGEMVLSIRKPGICSVPMTCNRNLLLMQSGDHTEGRYVSVGEKLQRRWDGLCR